MSLPVLAVVTQSLLESRKGQPQDSLSQVSESRLVALGGVAVVSDADTLMQMDTVEITQPSVWVESVSGVMFCRA